MSTSSKSTGVAGRLLFEVGGGELDFKAKYSEIEAGAINFNASIALADAAAFLGAPAFYEDPNDHNFRYINNIEPQNEQENVNLSLKGDWDLGFATLTGYVAWNDQTNFFLTDGTSGAFSLYAFEATGTCPATNDANLTDPGYEPPFFAASRRASGSPRRLVARPDFCRRTVRPPATVTSISSAISRTPASSCA